MFNHDLLLRITVDVLSSFGFVLTTKNTSGALDSLQFLKNMLDDLKPSSVAKEREKHSSIKVVVSKVMSDVITT